MDLDYQAMEAILPVAQDYEIAVEAFRDTKHGDKFLALKEKVKKSFITYLWNGGKIEDFCPETKNTEFKATFEKRWKKFADKYGPKEGDIIEQNADVANKVHQKAEKYVKKLMKLYPSVKNSPEYVKMGEDKVIFNTALSVYYKLGGSEYRLKGFLIGKGISAEKVFNKVERYSKPEVRERKADKVTS